MKRLNRIIAVLCLALLACMILPAATPAALAKAALNDKKRAGGSITLVLPEAIGRCRLEKVPVSELPRCFEAALESQEALGL